MGQFEVVVGNQKRISGVIEKLREMMSVILPAVRVISRKVYRY